MLDVVAEYPASGCVQASYAVRNPLSLLNHERRIDDEAIEFTCPADPKYANPCVSDDRKRLDEKVDDAVEKRPCVNPIVVPVAL